MTEREICEKIERDLSCLFIGSCSNCPLNERCRNRAKYECQDVVRFAREWLAEHQENCIWTEDENGNWHTACGEMHTFFDGGPVENGYRFCPYCGRTLEEKKYVEEDMRMRMREKQA